MEGWIDGFEEDGLVGRHRDRETERLRAGRLMGVSVNAGILSYFYTNPRAVETVRLHLGLEISPEVRLR